MQNTSNYNLNIVEGTDIVNIPVQLNPNFQTIDSEMFKNKQGSTGTATEVVTGTVHAIVRANPDADVFRYTATGNWTSGDTMTVDGGAVTVHLTDGTAPGTGAYVIGAEVVAVINGTLVTLISSSNFDPGVTSFNNRTGAVTPTASDYDASLIDYDNTVSGLNATDVQSAIDEIVSGAGADHGIYEMWLNSDLSLQFAAGNVNIITDKNIDTFLIEFGDISTGDVRSIMTAEVGASGYARYFGLANDGVIIQFTRSMSIASSLGGYTITFGDCSKRARQNNGTVSDTTANDNLLPVRIFAIVHNT